MLSITLLLLSMGNAPTFASQQAINLAPVIKRAPLESGGGAAELLNSRTAPEDAPGLTVKIGRVTLLQPAGCVTKDNRKITDSDSAAYQGCARNNAEATTKPMLFQNNLAR
ncbi:MAG: hypothetical protein ACXWP5_15690 [Bdellovibrionota bacterium]